MTTTKIKKLSNGYSYKYTDLATIHDELEKQNITYSQEIKYNTDAQADYIWTTLVIDGEKQAPVCGCRIVAGKLSGGNAAQEQGSALTYARRYSLLMALGWACEDDDGAKAGGSVASKSYGQTANKEYKTSNGRLDFDKLKSYLSTLDNAGKVLGAKSAILAKHPNITDKQKAAVDRIFKERLESFEVEMTEFSDEEIPEM